MKTKDDQLIMHRIATITLEAVNRLTGTGNIGVEELTAQLLSSEELETLTRPPSGDKKFLKDEILRLKREFGELKDQYGKVDTKRRELAVQLDTAENLNERCNAFLHRLLPALGQLVRPTGDAQLIDAVNRITKLLKSNASIDALESAFLLFKETAFRAAQKQEPSPPPPKTPAILKLFKRHDAATHPDPVLHFREAYLEMVEEFRLNLDHAALSEFSKIKSHLTVARHMDDFISIRQQLISLLKSYVSRISVERKQAAAFIFEVEERLSDVENQMLRSLTVSNQNRAAGTRFTDTIEKEIDSFQETVDFSQSLEELKSKIMDRISAIKQVIEANRKEGLDLNNQADKEVAALKKSLDRMKNEISAAKKRSESLEAELLSDPLTRAFNRRAYDQRIHEELKRHQRYQSVFSILLLDVDHFKQINDKFGHAVGDLCLKEIINRIRPLLRETDFLARYGGEEFVIILPETETDGALKAGEKIRSHIEKTDFLHRGESVKVTISLGVTQVQPKDETEDDIFDRADKAMYQAKQSGRNKVVML